MPTECIDTQPQHTSLFVMTAFRITANKIRSLPNSCCTPQQREIHLKSPYCNYFDNGSLYIVFLCHFRCRDVQRVFRKIITKLHVH